MSEQKTQTEMEQEQRRMSREELHEYCRYLHNRAADMADDLEESVGLEVAAQWGCLLYKGLVDIYNTTKDEDSRKIAMMFLGEGQALLETADRINQMEIMAKGFLAGRKPEGHA